MGVARVARAAEDEAVVMALAATLVGWAAEKEPSGEEVG